MTDPVFELTLADAEYVVEELPQRDGFTRTLRDWIAEERARLDRAAYLADPEYDPRVW